ncbi:MAG: Elongation factor Ts [Alphaproteobacteria bacterium MarineAlpha5_Bin8]|nr:MAG: Elongation factor Ts [Alphaproteobacteria bacterium MarineAlpha5_Bin8]
MSDLMDKIKNLREMTGAGFLDCKLALKENDHNLEKSIDFLRKKGLVKASKKSMREAKEGAVGLYLNDKKTVMLEINAETDFATKNEIFLDFFDKIGNIALSLENIENLSVDDFLKSKHEDKILSDYFTDIIAKIGENIVLKKIIKINKEDNSEFFSYTHNSYKKNIGKICVLLKANVEKNNEESAIFGKNLCMHIAASKPLAFDKKDLDPKIVEREKNVQKESILATKKPDNIVEKILNGKMEKFYSEVTFLNQPFILDTDKKVRDVIDNFSKNNNFSILNYKIFILGEE